MELCIGIFFCDMFCIQSRVLYVQVCSRLESGIHHVICYAGRTLFLCVPRV